MAAVRGGLAAAKVWHAKAAVYALGDDPERVAVRFRTASSPGRPEREDLGSIEVVMPVGDVDGLTGRRNGNLLETRATGVTLRFPEGGFVRFGHYRATEARTFPGVARPEAFRDAYDPDAGVLDAEAFYGNAVGSFRRMRGTYLVNTATAAQRLADTCLDEVPAGDIAPFLDAKTGRTFVKVRISEARGADGRVSAILPADRVFPSLDAEGREIPDTYDVKLRSRGGGRLVVEYEGKDGPVFLEGSAAAVGPAYNGAARARTAVRDYHGVPGGPGGGAAPGASLLRGVPEEWVSFSEGWEGPRKGEASVSFPPAGGDGWRTEVRIPYSDTGPTVLSAGRPGPSLDRDMNPVPGRVDIPVAGDGEFECVRSRTGPDGRVETERSMVGRDFLEAAWEARRDAFGLALDVDGRGSAGPGTVRNARIRTRDVDGRARPFASARFVRDGRAVWGRFFVDGPGAELERVREDGNGGRLADVRLSAITDVYFGKLEDGGVKMSPADLESAREAIVDFDRKIAARRLPDVPSPDDPGHGGHGGLGD